MKQLYLYFVNELVVSGDEKPVLTTVAAVAVGSGYDKDNKSLQVTVPETVTSTFWNPVTSEGNYASTRLILVKATGSSPAATAPVITTTAIKSAIVSKDYTFTLKATGTAPITWSITEGSLPAGLSLSGDVISGKPEKEGSSAFTVKAENSVGSVIGKFTLSVYSYTEQKVVSADIVGDKPAGVTGVTTADASGNDAVIAAYNGIDKATWLGNKVGDIDTKQIEAIQTSFLVNVSHDETASGDIKLKVTFGTPITMIEGAKYYLLIPEKEDAELMALGAVTKVPTFGSFAADEITSKDVTFTVRDFNKYFTEAPVFLAAVKEAAPDNGGGSSSGCSAGTGALALIALLPLAFMRKNSKQQMTTEPPRTPRGG